jgi:uncharacterized membrane protein YjgN (DUF898 family)
MDRAPALNTSNSSVSRPAPLPQIETYPVEFTGSGSEYFRIWIVNVLLIMVTFGIYTPWAKVRAIKYFYGNTLVDGHALDFHGEPKKMLRGTAIVGAFFILYSLAAEVSVIAAVVSVIAFMVIWPPLYRAGLKFRLANTSWRGLRMRLLPASLKEAYFCLTIPNLLLFTPLLVFTLGVDAEGPKQVVDTQVESLMPIAGLGILLFALTLPYFIWRLNRYRIGHSAWGPLRMEFRSEAGAMYKVFLKALAVAVLIVAAFGILVALMVPGLFGGGGLKRAGFGLIFAIIPLFFVFAIVMNVVPRAYLAANLQNLLWSRTGNSSMRFKSELSPWRYIALQIKTYFLIVITLGLYWPFAAVANRRMQVEAVELKSRVSLEQVSDVAQKREQDAAGDAAADLFDFDLGM